MGAGLPLTAVWAQEQDAVSTAGASASELAGTAWQVTLQPRTTVGEGVPQTDLITFDAETMRSGWLSDAGFPDGTYTVESDPDGGMLWDAVQPRWGAEIVYWRGEVTGRAMHGTVSRYLMQGGIEDYAFSGVKAEQPQAASSRPPDQPT